VFPVADAHVFDEPRRIEFLRQLPHLMTHLCELTLSRRDTAAGGHAGAATATSVAVASADTAPGTSRRSSIDSRSLRGLD
jgi:hypothetical protein